jgi:hypothetical protein
MTNPSISLFQQSWVAPKQEYADEQNEDARRIELAQHAEGTTTLLLAVSDGASGAVFSRLWAQALVEAARFDWPTLGAEVLDKQLQRVRQEFKPLDPTQEYPWYVKTKLLTEGSQATLLVVTVASAKNMDAVEVRAVSVGDSCLLLFRKNELKVHSFPLSASADFGVNPSLVSSIRRPLEYRHLPPTLLQPGDFLLVCTDAIAKWVIQCLELGMPGAVFEVLLDLLMPEAAELNSSLMASSNQAMPRTGADSTAPKVDSLSKSIPDKPPKFRLSQLTQWRRLWFAKKPGLPEAAKTTTPARQESAAGQLALESNEVAGGSAQPATIESDAEASLKFQRFIERYRRPEGRPRLRDDDATLVLCLPIRGGNKNQPQEAMEVIRSYQTAAAGRELLIQPANAAPLRSTSS